MTRQIQHDDRCAFCGDTAEQHVRTMSGLRCGQCHCRQFMRADTIGPWCRGSGLVLRRRGEACGYGDPDEEMWTACPGCPMCPAEGAVPFAPRRHTGNDDWRQALADAEGAR